LIKGKEFLQFDGIVFTIGSAKTASIHYNTCGN